MFKKKRVPGQHSLELPAKDEPSSPVTEAYRVLRTNLQYYNLDQPLRVVEFTSAGPAEGKSSTVSNLAIVMAEAGQRVVVVDCDLRKPVQHRLFNVSRQIGLTSVITGRNSLEDALSTTEWDKLHVLPAGPTPPNPSEMLATKKMAEIISVLRDGFDTVLLDAPPLLPVTDAAVLARNANGVIVVVRAEETTRDAVEKAVQRLHSTKAKILGAVLNGIKSNVDEYHYYHYYGTQS